MDVRVVANGMNAATNVRRDLDRGGAGCGPCLPVGAPSRKRDAPQLDGARKASLECVPCSACEKGLLHAVGNCGPRRSTSWICSPRRHFKINIDKVLVILILLYKYIIFYIIIISIFIYG